MAEKLISKPTYITKLYRSGVFKYKGGGSYSWSNIGKSTNRYNKDNDHYLDELEMHARAQGFNDMQIAAMIGNAIHENQGSPLPKGSRVGLWQNDKRQLAHLGTTVKQNVKAFKEDYDYGKWYSTTDKNGWNPIYHKLFKNGTTVDDVTYGMVAGYERFGGSNNRNNSEVKRRQRTARIVYDLLRKGVKPSAMVEIINNYNFENPIT